MQIQSNDAKQIRPFNIIFVRVGIVTDEFHTPTRGDVSMLTGSDASVRPEATCLQKLQF